VDFRQGDSVIALVTAERETQLRDVFGGVR